VKDLSGFENLKGLESSIASPEDYNCNYQKQNRSLLQ
jgi:hypothetical protein